MAAAVAAVSVPEGIAARGLALLALGADELAADAASNCMAILALTPGILAPSCAVNRDMTRQKNPPATILIDTRRAIQYRRAKIRSRLIYRTSAHFLHSGRRCPIRF